MRGIIIDMKAILTLFLIVVITAVFCVGCNSTWNFAWKSVITSPTLESQGEITLETHQDDAAVNADTDVPIDVNE